MPFFESSPESSSPSPLVVEWLFAHTTYYVATDNPKNVVGGVCKYEHLLKDSYGLSSAVLGEALFGCNQICSACFKLYVGRRKPLLTGQWCIPDTSIVVMATNFCAPNYEFDAESDGGHYNPLKQHYVLPIKAFENAKECQGWLRWSNGT